ncbi:MAG: adenylyltransferase/cytidyltransferase family protein [Elusimicrobia bacterium]|nr:adenylyltransferase/cytidyltransferase family protein [Candidatus Obscuribacterium magneticum]
MKTKKILSWSALRQKLQAARRRGKKIVFTNGCFDLLHIGHMKVFAQCKKWGDLLVVGLNSDRSVKRLKGPKRPLVAEKERAALVASLADVDFVALFPQDTPAALVRLVRPDVLVKGGDWAAGQIVGKDVAKKVVRIPLVKGRSTSNLIRLIVKRYAR